MTETARWPISCCRRRCSWSTTICTRRAATATSRSAPKLIEPPGECRSNHAVLQGLAARLGAKHRGFRDERDGDHRRDACASPAGRTRRPCWRTHWIDVAPPFAEAHFHNGFPQPDKRFHFAPDWRAIGPDWARMPTLPDYMPATDEATPDRPFRMVTAPARQFLNTSFTETPTSRRAGRAADRAAASDRCGAPRHRRRRAACGSAMRAAK